MALLLRFFHYSLDTYGGAPILLAMTLVQVTLLGWVFVEGARSAREMRRLPADEWRVRAAARAEIWEKRVRPLSLTLMLLGPGLGLGMSTLLGALGMGSLSEVMGQPASADLLAATLAHAYRDISFAYFLMVGGTFPMLLGPVIVMAARRLDEEGEDARGGDPSEVLLHTLKGLLAVAEAQASRAQLDSARTHALLEQATSALQRRLVA
jgi:hypothetical protein